MRELIMKSRNNETFSSINNLLVKELGYHCWFSDWHLLLGYIHKYELIDENNSLATVKELLDSRDRANTLIAAEILVKLKIKK